MINDHHIDPLEIQNTRPDRDHIFRGLSVYQRLDKLNGISGEKPKRLSDKTRWAVLKKHRDRLQAEIESLSAALNDCNQDALRHAICGSETILHELAHVGNVPIQRDMEKTTDALLTRLCMDDYDLNATVEHYLDLGLKVHVETDPVHGYRIVRSTEHQVDNLKNVYAEGQLLSSKFYRDPEFTTFFK